jgi:butyryl-CoA dehydrogenase
LGEYARALTQALQDVRAATQAAWSTGDPAQALANAVPYMQAFGHMVLAWVWLDVVLAIPHDAGDVPAHQGRLRAARYFYRYELPKIGAWLSVAASRDATCAGMPEEAF